MQQGYMYAIRSDTSICIRTPYVGQTHVMGGVSQTKRCMDDLILNGSFRGGQAEPAYWLLFLAYPVHLVRVVALEGPFGVVWDLFSQSELVHASRRAP